MADSILSSDPGEGEVSEYRDRILRTMTILGRHMGVQVRLPEQPGSSPDPESLVGEIARASGLRYRKVILPPGWWRTDAGPLLAFRSEDKRPAALLPDRSGGYRISAPDRPVTDQVSEANSNQFLPHAWMFYRTFPHRMDTPWAPLMFGLKGKSRDIATVLLATVMMTALGMVTPFVVGLIVGTVLPLGDQPLLLLTGLALISAALGVAAFQFFQGQVMVRLDILTGHEIQAAVWDRLLRLPVSFFRSYSSGEILNRVSAVEEIRRQVSGSTARTVLSSAAAFLNLILLFLFSWRLAAPSLVAGIIIVLSSLWAGKHLLRHNAEIMERTNTLSGLAVQLLRGIAKIRIAGVETFAFNFWREHFSRKHVAELNARIIRDRMLTFNSVLPLLCLLVIFPAAGNIPLPGTGGPGGSFSPARFLAFYTAFGLFFAGILSLSETAMEILNIYNLNRQIRPIMDSPLENSERAADPGPLRGGLSLNRVSFRYRNDQAPVIDTVSLAVEPGGFIALVGPSGSGKSTLLRLILGFDSPESGSIRFDGRPMEELDIAAVRRQIGVVLQNSLLPAGSLIEAVSGGASLSMDEIWRLLRLVDMEEDVKNMPMGLYTVISEGGFNFSGGQRQRLLIARALARNPKILLFDEATSALDNRSQHTVSVNLEQMRVTRIVVAHRLSTVKNADRIYVLDRGKVVEEGTCEELMEHKRLFYSLASRQIS